MEKLSGNLSLKIDGVKFAAVEEWTVSKATHKKETVIDADGTVIGYKEVDQKAPKMAGSVVLPPEISPDYFQEMTGSTVELTAGSRTFIGTDGINVSDEEYNAKDSTIELEFNFGFPIDEY